MCVDARTHARTHPETHLQTAPETRFSGTNAYVRPYTTVSLRRVSGYNCVVAAVYRPLVATASIGASQSTDSRPRRPDSSPPRRRHGAISSADRRARTYTKIYENSHYLAVFASERTDIASLDLKLSYSHARTRTFASIYVRSCKKTL